MIGRLMPEQAKISEYNSAFSQLYRLDNLWQQANYLSVAGNIVQWNWILDAIWRELGGDSTKQEVQIFNRFKPLFAKYRNKRNALYQLLERKELFLRKLQNKQGKGTKYQDPDEDSMEE